MTTQTLEVLVKRDFADKISSDYLVKELTKDFADNKEIVKILTSELNHGGTADFIANMKNYIEFSKGQAPKIDISKALNEKDPDALEAKVIQTINHFENALVDKAKEIAKNDPQFSIMETTKNGKPAGYALETKGIEGSDKKQIPFNQSPRNFLSEYVKSDKERYQLISDAYDNFKEKANQITNTRTLLDTDNLFEYMKNREKGIAENILIMSLFNRTNINRDLDFTMRKTRALMVYAKGENPDYTDPKFEKPEQYMINFIKYVRDEVTSKHSQEEINALVNMVNYNSVNNVKSYEGYDVLGKISQQSTQEELRDVASRLVKHYANFIVEKMSDHIQQHNPDVSLKIENNIPSFEIKTLGITMDLTKTKPEFFLERVKDLIETQNESVDEAMTGLYISLGVKKPKFDLER